MLSLSKHGAGFFNGLPKQLEVPAESEKLDAEVGRIWLVALTLKL